MGRIERLIQNYDTRVSLPWERNLAGPQRVWFAVYKVDEATVVAIYGVAGLFGFMKTSELVSKVEVVIRGRLLVFFPGEYERNLYRFMDARDGFNYMAVPITCSERLPI